MNLTTLRPLLRGYAVLPAWEDIGGLPPAQGDTGDFIAAAEQATLPDLAPVILELLEGVVEAVAWTDSASPADTLGIPVVIASLADTVTTADALSGTASISGLLTDTLSPVDSFATHWATSFTDTPTAADTLGVPVFLSGLSDSASSVDVLTGALGLTGAFSDTPTSTDSLSWLWLATSMDSASPTDTLGAVTAITAGFTDTPTAADTLTGVIAVYGLLTDGLTTADALAGNLVLYGVFSDTPETGDVLFTQSQRLFVVNADTKAVSEYTFTPTLQGLGQWRNQLVISTSDGLYALDADTDAGATITWEFRSGFSHLGTDRLKRVRDVNVLARGAGDVRLILVSDRYGQKQEAKYKLTKLTADAFRDQVIKAGQGYQSVYWQVGCQGEGPAEIDELRVAVEPLSRRR